MSKEKAFVIGDVHGMYHSFQVMLTHWNREEEQLIMVGDYIDRGPHSYQMLTALRDLQAEEDIRLLRGNHEQLFINFLKNPRKEAELYERNGGISTLTQILNVSEADLRKMGPAKVAQAVQGQEPWLFSWLEDLLYYSTFGDFIIVHAGLDFTKKDWRHTSLHNFLWIREPFHRTENTLDRPIIFGHTPVQTLHGIDEPWVKDNKWGIDGGSVFGGSLIGLHIDKHQVLNQVIYR